MLLHARLLEQKRQKELQERNLNAKRRLQEIASGTENKHINDLKNVSKVAESILNKKDVENEYEQILTQFDIMRDNDLLTLRSSILDKFNNDVYFTRIFSKYTELLGKLVIDATQKKLIKKSGNPVKFYDGRQ